jgi:hypothetical protein
MSATGIPLFYGAHDAETAVVETVEPADTAESAVSLGHFELTAPLLVVDMTALPPTPSLFDREHRDRRDELIFLNGFARDISKPVRRDGSEHIDYVPTQVVCEYLRHEFSAPDGRRPQGVLFRSSTRPQGTVTALFIDRDDCLDAGQDPTEGRPQLMLRAAKRVHVVVHVGIRRMSDLPLSQHNDANGIDPEG